MLEKRCCSRKITINVYRTSSLFEVNIRGQGMKRVKERSTRYKIDSVPGHTLPYGA